MRNVGRRIWGPLAGAGLCGLVTGCVAADAPHHAIEYRPDAALDRLQILAAEAPEAGLAIDFELGEDRLYLLEPAGRVIILRRAITGWVLDGEFGRSGGGPGEFLGAHGIARAGNGLVLAEEKRLQFFTPAGELQTVKLLSLPCQMRRPAAAAARAGIFVHGRCYRVGYVTDTLKAILAWSADTSSFEIIAEDVELTRDGSVGSAFGARQALTTGPAELHLFGAGTTNCFWRIQDTGARPTAERSCPAVVQVYRADPPPGVERRLRARRQQGDRLTWPSTLPPFVDRLIIGNDVVLLRPFSADSVVIQLASPRQLDLGVAPLNGFVGCKATGCLWLLEDAQVPRVIVLDAERIAALIEQRAVTVIHRRPM